jgi:flagellar M-ring protein FliF
VKRVAHTTPQISKISIAVMVDGVTTEINGKPVWHARSAAKLAVIRSLVKTAIGYDKTRGDLVDVQSLPFVQMFPGAASKPATLIARALNSDLLASLLRTLIIAAAGLVALFFVFRPLMIRLAGPAAVPAASPALGEAEAQDGRLAAPDDAIRLGQVEGPLSAASIRRISDLVETYPDASLAVIRGWLNTGTAQ